MVSFPGPRMQLAGRAMDVTGAYPLLGYSWELKLPKGVEEVDGPEGGRKAVREQISNGVDWIKVYSDRSYYLRSDGVLDDVPTFTVDELKTIVDETHRQHRKIASHAAALNGVHNSVEAGVDSIEHGMYISDADLKMMVAHGTYYVPTLFVGEYVAQRTRRGGREGVGGHDQDSPGYFSEGFEGRRQDRVWNRRGRIRLEDRSSQRVRPHGEVRHDSRPGVALCNHDGGGLLGMQDRIGSLEAGKNADIVAVPGDPLNDIQQLEKVNFVIKGGAVYVRP